MNGTKALRQHLWKSQNGLCFYCSEVIVEYAEGVLKQPSQIEHKIPISRGGSDDLENLALACMHCNASKGTKTAEEFIATRHFKTQVHPTLISERQAAELLGKHYAECRAFAHINNIPVVTIDGKFFYDGPQLTGFVSVPRTEVPVEESIF